MEPGIDMAPHWILPLKIVFEGSSYLYFIVYFTFCMHYYRMVDAIGSESFWLGENHQELIDERQRRLRVYTLVGNVIMYVT